VRGIQVIGAIFAAIAAIVYLTFGTLSPCGVLRETIRERDGWAAILPDTIVDVDIAEQAGGMSPGRCLDVLAKTLSTAHTPELKTSQAASTAHEALNWAAKETERASHECRAKRLSGELPTYLASAQCSNPRMLQAFKAAHYRHLDLIEHLAAMRVEFAGQMDRGELTEQEVMLETQKAYASIQETEEKRDGVAQ
jgi:hypothetical protein